jgi:formylglycine-generating enzyme
MSMVARLAAVVLVALGIGACGQHAATEAPPRACLAGLVIPDPVHKTAGMVFIHGGKFLMGAQPAHSEEGPPHEESIGSFWIDRTDVTNAQFAKFVAATHYVTLAERPLDPKRYPNLSAEQRKPSSLVFVGADDPAFLFDPSRWWRIVPGADWRHPQGPQSTIEGRDSLPVVHIAYEDALAYAHWLGRDLPSEAEWEYAARGGLDNKRYAWGDAHPTDKRPRANTWQGVFPVIDAGTDGYKARAAPVGCFPPNGYGLYDMAGNVWQWTQDWYRPGLDPVSQDNSTSPDDAFDPDDPATPKHVIKGGSFLCSDDFCFRYRPAARAPGPGDSGASHIGFRTILRS